MGEPKAISTLRALVECCEQQGFVWDRVGVADLRAVLDAWDLRELRALPAPAPSDAAEGALSDEAMAVQFYALNPSAALVDLSRRIGATAALPTPAPADAAGDDALDAARWRAVRSHLTIAHGSMERDGRGPYRHFLQFLHAGRKFIPGSGNVPVPAGPLFTLLDAAADAIAGDENAYLSALNAAARGRGGA